MASTVKHKMLKKGSTSGKITGRWRSWAKDEVIDAPEGEFDHLPKSYYTVLGKPAKSAGEVETATAPEAPEKAVSKTKRSKPADTK